MGKIERIKGTRDLLGGQALALDRVARSLEEHFLSHGYEPVDTPVLESFDLFLRKSGGELISHMYTFTDPGGRQVSLRPEFTASVIRAFLQSEEKELPQRWQYRGPVFRHLFAGSPYRQFTQQGVELLGASGPLADAEVLAMAGHGLGRLGLKGYQMVVGHIGIILSLMAGVGLSERMRQSLASFLGDLSHPQGVSRAREELQQQLGEAAPAPGLLFPRIPQTWIQGLVQEHVPEGLGSRLPEDIVSRFLARSRSRDRWEQVEKGLALAQELAQVKGSPASALKKARSMARRLGLDASLLEELGALADLLEGEGLEVTIDLGLARGLAYYTGVVFELRHPALASGPVLGGGGRYDGLVRALGGERDIPALGFAYCLEGVAQALGEDVSNQRPHPQVLISPARASAGGLALQMARGLRQKGQLVELDLVGGSLEEVLSRARSRGIPKVLLVEAGGEVVEYAIP